MAKKLPTDWPTKRPAASLYGRSFPGAPTSDHGKVTPNMSFMGGGGITMKRVNNTTGNEQFSSESDQHAHLSQKKAKDERGR